MSVTKLDEYQDHIVIDRIDGVTTYIPVPLIQDVIKGETKITDIDEWEMIMRSIVEEWYRRLIE